MCTVQVGTSRPDGAFEQLTTGDCVTGMRLIVDGCYDEEVTILDSRFGASSAAPPNSGIPSAMTQHKLAGVCEYVVSTSMANRLQRSVQNLVP